MSSLPRLLCAAARREKNQLTWVLVSHSSLPKSLLLLSSFALRMPEATCVGSALSLVFSPISDFAIRYSFTLAQNLGAPRRGSCSAHPSGSSHLNPVLLLDAAVLQSELADYFTWSTVVNFWANSLISLPKVDSIFSFPRVWSPTSAWASRSLNFSKIIWQPDSGHGKTGRRSHPPTGPQRSAFWYSISKLWSVAG